jgi:hypothetical protein
MIKKHKDCDWVILLKNVAFLDEQHTERNNIL